ncbi:ABC transporter substrate-binding protein [Spirillospora sp. CA-128828]|uniref:ABC transporter substrate-binding protein n=1 Tax=Spirillospora sp. CA-128828 TaxID=3240033 RepID=UPI003D909E0D
MRHTRPACSAAIAAALLITSACSSVDTKSGDASARPGYLGVADASLPAGGTLKLGTHVDIGGPTGLDPQMADVASTWTLMSPVYETLTTIGPDYSVQPLLAESWDTPSDTTYVFHLREGVTFSNGRTMTADDVVGSLKRLLGSESVWRGQLGPVESVAKQDVRTVKVTLSAPYSPFLAALANIPAAVLPMKEIKDGSLDPVKRMLGTGPFTVVNHRQDVSWAFKRNDRYWQKGKPAVDGLEVAIVPEEAARVAALQNGSESMAILGNVDSRTTLAGASNVNVATQATTDFYYLMLNTRKAASPFADPRVRTAINIAMDRTKIANAAMGGQGKPTAVTPAGLPGACDPASLPSAKAGLDKAKSLLAEAGARNLSFTLSIYSTQPAPVVAQVIQQNLQRIGVKVNIEQMDEASWSGMVYGEAPKPAKFDAALSWFAGYADPAMVMRWWNPEQAGFNVGFMKPDPALNKLIKAAGETPGTERKTAMSEVCAKVDQDAQMIPLVTRPATVAYRTDLLSPSVYASEGYGNVLRLVADARVKSK